MCRSCQNPDGTEDLKKGTQLLEVYALEIQMYTEQKDTKKLKQLYQKALYIKSAIPHPRIMGIIRECGGKMHMHERIWSEAATDFFEVARNTLPHAPGYLIVQPQLFRCAVLSTQGLIQGVQPAASMFTMPFGLKQVVCQPMCLDQQMIADPCALCCCKLIASSNKLHQAT